MAEYIERSKAVDAIAGWMSGLCDCNELFAFHLAMCTINRIPPADVSPVVHARWIWHDNADIVEGYYVPEYECSACRGWVKDDSDFCPNCGADMRGEQDG